MSDVKNLFVDTVTTINVHLLVDTCVRYWMFLLRLFSTFSKVFRNDVVWFSTCRIVDFSRDNSPRECPILNV